MIDQKDFLFMYAVFLLKYFFFFLEYRMEYDLDINLHCFAFVITKNLIKMIRAINKCKSHIF